MADEKRVSQYLCLGCFPRVARGKPVYDIDHECDVEANNEAGANEVQALPPHSVLKDRIGNLRVNGKPLKCEERWRKVKNRPRSNRGIREGECEKCVPPRAVFPIEDQSEQENELEDGVNRNP